MTDGWSLRTRLLTSLALLAAVLFGVTSVQSYLTYRETSGRLFDDSLRESAGLLLQLAEHEIAEHGQILGVALLRAETTAGPYGFEFQLWTPDMQAGVHTSALSTTPLLPFSAEGFGWTSIQGRSWRTYSTWNSAHTLQMQIAQPQGQRQALNRRALTGLIAMNVILTGAAGLVVWWIVSASIRPLQRTADSVGQRSERDLGSVAVNGAPREVRPLLDSINRLLRRVGEALQMERRFTADAAHELRTPLAAIRANAQVLVAARDAVEREASAHDLLASVDRSSRLIDQLLSLARADQSAGATDMHALDLAAVVDEQVAAHGTLAMQAGVRLRSTLQPVLISADPALLAVLVRNLLDNALHYTPAGGAVHVSVAGDAGSAILSVEDTGPGIPVEVRGRIFERFYRVAANTTAGSGLGLSLVNCIAELHTATITVAEGIAGAGTCMRVAFPRLPP